MSTQRSSLLEANTFYDEVSDFYGQMIDFEKNLDLRINAYKTIFPQKGCAADFGCGIGLDSIALAINGHSVTAVDISPKMIVEAKLNATKYNVNIKAHVHSFSSLPKSFSKKFNSVVSVGNTIAHLNSNQLKKAIKKMYGVLLPDGKIFMHILNYSLIRKQNTKINNIAKRDGKIIIRFYDFSDDKLQFNILSFPVDSPKNYKLVTTPHYPHTKREINFYLKNAGFKKIKFMKNFSGEQFNDKDSKDVFIQAIK
jgi:SAM-dependent methyltransferase